MKRTKIELPFNYFHFILLGVILFILSLKYYYVLILLAIFIYYIRKEKLVIKYLFVIISILSLFIVLEPKSNSNDFYATIINIEESNRTNKLTLKTNGNNKIVYLSKDIKIDIGDYGYYKCKPTNSNNSYNGSFNYKEYLYNSYIDNTYFVEEYTYIKNKFTISKIHYSIRTYFESKLEDETLKYTLLLVLGVDSFNKEESNVVSTLGIMHLFCISGMHINFILLFVSLILTKFNIENNKIEKVQIMLVTILLIITNFQLSVIRAFLMFIITYIFKKSKIKYSNIDVICITALLILLFRPRYLYLVSFQLTYLVTFILIITNDLYKNKSMLITLSIQSVVAFTTTFPIIVNMNYEINFMTIIFTTFISIPFTYVIMPLSFITAVLGINIFNPIFRIFDILLYDLSKIDILIFSIQKMNLLCVCIYYILLILIVINILKKKLSYKYITLLFCFLFCIINSTKLNNVTTVTFFDVGQGDSSLISLAYNKGNILIDCYNGVGNYIKTRGIKNIDYLIITHAHNDHMGDLEVIKEDFKVGSVVCSYYDQDSKKLNGDLYVSAGDKIQLDNIELNFIAPYKSHSDINQASLVFTVNINGYTFLYTGDTTIEVEEVLINKSNVKADVLKVPHHGSDTSSSIEFVTAVNPKYSIFSYGKDNSYGLPNKEVMNRYTMSINYETPIDGHIEFYYKKEWNIRFYK